MKYYLMMPIIGIGTLLIALVTTAKFAGAQEHTYLVLPDVGEEQPELDSQFDTFYIERTTKDIWDIVDCVSGLISGAVIALIGVFITYQYNKRQQTSLEAHNAMNVSVEQVRTIRELIPYLISENEREREIALLLVAKLNDPEFTFEFAGMSSSEGAASALKKMSLDSNPAISIPAKKALDNLSKLEQGALDKLRLICQDYSPEGEFEEHLFMSSTYGQGVAPYELEVMIKYGWVEKEGRQIRITEAGRKATEYENH